MEFLAGIDIYFCLLAAAGVALGIVFGAIPGMTATMAVAVCLPLTYSLGLHDGLALLLGLYVGGISGGLVPAILLNIPGTPSSITTTFDGYPMALNGEAGRALRVSIVASLCGGLFSVAVLMAFAPLLAEVAIRFSYVEKFLVILLALTVIVSLSRKVLASIISGLLGILLSLVGTYDVAVGGNGEYRLVPDFLAPELASGFSLLPVLLGLFGVATILDEACRGFRRIGDGPDLRRERGRWHVLSDFRGQVGNVLRSSAIGTFVGMLPGIGGSAASVLAYTQQRNLSRRPERLGKGEPEGLIASESANNGLTGGALIPLLSLGIPGDATTAVLIGAFTLQGIQVGPLFIGENPDTWRLMIVALLIANLVMFALMYFAIRHVVRLVAVPPHLLYPLILMMCVIGAYTINYGILFDVWTLLGFGVFGFLALRIGIQLAPLVIGFILGGQAEVYFVKSLEAHGSLTVFFTRSPIALLLWGLIALSLFLSMTLGRRGRSSDPSTNPAE